MIETTINKCHYPLCGCGECSNMDEPQRDCNYIICGCGCCEEEE